MAEIILTADRTLMNDYRGNEFIGFGSTAPPNLLPDWFYKLLFFPPIKTKKGVPLEAPYGLRKIESLIDWNIVISIAVGSVIGTLTVWALSYLLLKLGGVDAFIRVIKESREFKNIVTELEQRMKIKEKKVI